MRKIEDLNSVCENWKPDRDAKGNLLKEKACRSCYFNLFGYCWIHEYNSGHRLVVSALEGDKQAERILWQRIADNLERLLEELRKEAFEE